MSKFVYVVSINYGSFNSFDEVHLFFKFQDAIDFLESQGFKRDFDDFYVVDCGDPLRTATISLHEVQGEAHGNSNTNNAN